jgi:hypothetical protein
MIRRPLLSVALSGALMLAGCGTLARPEGPLRIAPESLIRVNDPRIRSDDTQKIQALADEIEGRLGRAGGHETILALSGGGANGAYGAGVVVGWTRRGDRPQFDVVTGVSTGALAAPFAFLGPDWDAELREAYVGGGTNGLLSARTFAAFAAPSLFSSRVLRTLVDQNVTPELLRQIAIEHAKGRRLLVATTDLDTQETVIWDMGVLATQGDADALTLFRDVLVASASIPGIFPPVLIAGVTGDGQVVQDMHVDGGVNTPFLAIPEDLLLWTNPSRARADSALYVIVNGQVGRNTGVTPGRIDGILARTYDSMSKASLRLSLAATAAFGSRNGMRVEMSAIPDNVTVSSLKFDTATMQALFELGQARSASGEAWASVSPSGRPGPLVAIQNAPESQIPEALATPAPTAPEATTTPTPSEPGTPKP